MSQQGFPEGVWPVMLTPFTAEFELDEPGVVALTAWYLDHGVAGLFALCQSSEIFSLTLDEQLRLLSLVQEATGGRVPVIASGHVSYAPSQQVDELQAVAGQHPDAVILISNRLGGPDASDTDVVGALEHLMDALPADLPLGVYECPYPYKRLLTRPVLEVMRDSGRFAFVKDTCCDADELRRRLEFLAGSRVQLYNANTATLLASLRAGAAGYSGVMANVHPDVYAWLCRHAHDDSALVEDVQALLTAASYYELKEYPSNAKLALLLSGLPIQPYGRAYKHTLLTATSRTEADQMNRLSTHLRALVEEGDPS